MVEFDHFICPRKDDVMLSNDRTSTYCNDPDFVFLTFFSFMAAVIIVYILVSHRFITDIYNPDRVNWPEVTPTSTVKITFRAYVFTYANIVTTGSENNWTVPYYTNDAALKSFLEGRGLNTEWWTFEPLTVDMRHPGIIKGMADALLGCREGDAVEVYMTYNMAYGDDYFGIIPKESPIAWFFTVDAVDPVDPVDPENPGGPVEPAN